MIKCVAIAFALAAQLVHSAPSHASTARDMVARIQWGVLVTISNRTEAEGSRVGDPFGNPNSIADIGGIPYIYASELDASFVDVAGGSDRVSFALTEASLVNSDGSANDTACLIGEGYGDPENPPCARLVLSGVVSHVAKGSDEETKAKAALFVRHSSFKHYPSGHDFFVAKISIDAIWLIDAYGGATILDPADYFAATPSAASLTNPSAVLHKKSSSLMKGWPFSGPPLPFFKVKTARWMTKNLNYGFLSTVSVRDHGATVGDAFGNPYSFADVGGVPYIYATDMDASMIDLFVGTNTTKPSNRATLALSEASFPDKILSNCAIGGYLGDPENPLCARMVLSGVVSKVDVGSDEEKSAKEALFARHPAFKAFPAGHGFYVAKLKLDGIWLIDIFGGAAVIKPGDYFKG